MPAGPKQPIVRDRTMEWHSGTPEMNAIKVGSLHYSSW
jgi:hypothetical protein